MLSRDGGNEYHDLRALTVERKALSQREKEVLDLVVTGMSNREIGSELGISERTAREHMARILLKLGVGTRVEAAVIATQWKFMNSE
ncbi:response regulator transcription factor [Streptomyces sp. NPDC127098]|uniref:response regulator transcription factor n=1 Tax=Streptomyces sp. NPDC127098 TaxID=3347137 RepID=UPI00365E04C5